MLVTSNADELIMSFNAKIEQTLINVGFDNMSLEEKNSLVVFIATKENSTYSDISADHILAYHKSIKIDALSQDCENAIIAGFTSTSNNHVYRTNRDDQLNMIGQKDALLADSTITTVSWKTEDAGYVDHTRDEWLAIYSEAFNHKKDQLVKYNTLKQQVQNTTKDSDIVAIVWQ